MCNWDNNDCLCAAGCTDAKLNNDECDEECDESACSFDNYDCVSSIQGDCASGCFNEMIGDGTCNSECNVADCNYDDNDCGCYGGCSFGDIGNCKVECMEPECSYDGTTDDSSQSKCSDDFTVTKYRYNHLIKHSFNATFNMSACTKADSSCTSTKLNEFYTKGCVDSSICNKEECLFQMGKCTTCTSAQAAECEICGPESTYDDYVCFKCKPEFFQYFSSCVTSCPTGYKESQNVSKLCTSNS